MLDHANIQPMPDVVVRRRFRRGEVRLFLSPATPVGEEWLARNAQEVAREADLGHRVFEVRLAAVRDWVQRMEAAGIVVYEEQPS